MLYCNTFSWECLWEIIFIPVGYFIGVSKLMFTSIDPFLGIIFWIIYLYLFLSIRHSTKRYLKVIYYLMWPYILLAFYFIFIHCIGFLSDTVWNWGTKSVHNSAWIISTGCGLGFLCRAVSKKIKKII